MVVILFGQVVGSKPVPRTKSANDSPCWAVAVISSSCALTLEFPVQGLKLGRGVSSHSSSSNTCQDSGLGKEVSLDCAKPRTGFTFWSGLPWSSDFHFWLFPEFSFEQPWVPKGEPGKGRWRSGVPFNYFYLPAEWLQLGEMGRLG